LLTNGFHDASDFRANADVAGFGKQGVPGVRKFIANAV
jgi:hypothetical protein